MSNETKLEWSQLPWKALSVVLRVRMFGAKKHGSPDGWLTVPNPRQYFFDKAMRHLIAWQEGEKRDLESGETHLAHAVCNLLFLIWHEMRIKVDVDQVAENFRQMLSGPERERLDAHFDEIWRDFKKSVEAAK